MNEEKYLPLPQPEELTLQEKEDAMGAYLMMFAAWGAGLPLPIINLIASIIYFFLNKSKSKFVHFHCHQALFSQLPTTLLNAACVFWAVRIIFFEWEFNNNFIAYLISIVIINIAYIAWGIIAAVQARKGRLYYMVFFGRFAFASVFAATNNENINKETPTNLPPR